MSYIYPTTTNGKTQYKIYFVYESNKIYLGSYPSQELAEKVLEEARMLMKMPSGLPNFEHYTLNYKKVVSLCNLRDHNKYIKNPIYLFPTYFYYYLSKDQVLIFDSKDLFYFSTYKIYKRGNYLYTQDSISQKNILSRFKIPNHSVIGKDYYFKNNNHYDFRSENLVIINGYKGVTKKIQQDQTLYVASIYIKSNLIIGHYHSEIEAAIAYNKAGDLLNQQGILKEFSQNVFPFLTKDEYTTLYENISISPRLFHPEHRRKRVISCKPFRGISKDQASYKVHIGYQSKQIYLGMYPTEKRAAQAYNYASFYLYGMQGHINHVSPLIYESDTEKIANFLIKHQALKSKI